MGLTDRRTLSTHDPFSGSGPQINNPIQLYVPIFLIVDGSRPAHGSVHGPWQAVKRRLKQERVDVGGLSCMKCLAQRRISVQSTNANANASGKLADEKAFVFAFVSAHGNATRHEIRVNFRDATGDV